MHIFLFHILNALDGSCLNSETKSTTPTDMRSLKQGVYTMDTGPIIVHNDYVDGTYKRTRISICRRNNVHTFYKTDTNSLLPGE